MGGDDATIMTNVVGGLGGKSNGVPGTVVFGIVPEQGNCYYFRQKKGGLMSIERLLHAAVLGFRIVLALGVLVACSAEAATCTWQSNGTWDTTPSSTADVIIVASGTSNLTWSSSMPSNVASWTQAAGYTATVTVQTVQGPTGFTNFTVSGDVALNGGTWFHSVYAAGQTNLLRVTVGGNLLVSNVTISANERGFSAAVGPGAGSGTIGGAYGGMSGGGASLALNAKTYGSIIAPANLGSGGGGAAGGGAILLTVAGTTTVASAGTISANGGSSGSNGGGSGGSVFLTTGWLTGNGTLRANGGSGPGGNASGGGSGGRVALILTGTGADFTSWTGTNTAFGTGAVVSAAGTVYRKTQAGVDTLLIDNNGASAYGQFSTLLTNAVNLNSFSNVVIRNKGSLGVNGDTTLDFNTLNLTVYGPTKSAIAINGDANVTYPTNWIVNDYTLYPNAITPNKLVNLTIGTNGVISQYQNSTAETYKVNLAISGNLTVLSNGTINADKLGYLFLKGPGANANTGMGAAYGGQAARGFSGSVLDPIVINTNTYGSIIAPTNLGSGGGDANGASAGGGAILLTVAGTTTVASAGTLSANGGSSGGNGGGSGGSVSLTTGWLTGNGTLRANGGAGPGGNLSGGGSGGRVAIVLTGSGADFTSWTGANTAFGTGSVMSAAGTVYRQAAANLAGAGTVIVNNGTVATNATFTSLPAFGNSAEMLGKTAWVTTNNARMGLVTNTAVESLSLSTNGVLELANYTLTVKSLTVTNQAARHGNYGPHDTPISRLTDTGSSGKVIVVFQGTMFIIN